MPSQPSTIQSVQCFPSFTLANDGRKVQLRNGCLYLLDSDKALTKSSETREYLLDYAKLTDDERHRITCGEWIETSGDQRQGKIAHLRMKYG